MRIARTAETFNPKCINWRGLGHGLWTPARSLHDEGTIAYHDSRVSSKGSRVREGLERGPHSYHVSTRGTHALTNNLPNNEYGVLTDNNNLGLCVSKDNNKKQSFGMIPMKWWSQALWAYRIYSLNAAVELTPHFEAEMLINAASWCGVYSNNRLKKQMQW